MADTINSSISSVDEECWSEIDEQSASEHDDVSPIVEAPAKRSRKVPARFKDSVCTPSTSKAIEEFDAVMKDSK